VAYAGPGWGGVTSTASGVVFSSDHIGNFLAVDATTGKTLYTYFTGAPIFAPPTTYSIDGRQYVVVPSGLTVVALALPR
jgi:alcohol dehydrogenase (cytochrome c)